MMDRMSLDRGTFTLSVDGWTIRAQHGLPAAYASYRQCAVLCDEFDLCSDQGDCCFVAVSRADEPRQGLVLAERYEPSGESGFSPGVAFVPETAVLFVGAGTRLLAYTLLDRPERLWEDATYPGFWGWSVHKPVVLMAAELEFTAWTKNGEKLWTTFVEPPWSYLVAGERVRLDVMGNITEFPVSSGPEVIQR
jgi:hypothetical protein